MSNYDLAIIGFGRVGSRAIELLLSKRPWLRILTLDCVDRRGFIDERKLNVGFAKVCNPDEVVNYVKGIDLTALALPSGVTQRYVDVLLKSSINVVDVSYINFDPYIYNELCVENNVFYIPDAGFAPGFSNLAVGYAQSKLGALDYVEIYVGGIPINPKPPFFYEVSWSPEDLIEEYVRKARVVEDYRVVEKDPLSEIMVVEIPGVGVFEAFFSDGLHTLIRNVKARRMFEATIRHPGHLRVVKVLRDLGFFSEEQIIVNHRGEPVSPKKFTAILFDKKFKQSSEDQAILYLKIGGTRGSYSLLAIHRGRAGLSATVDFTALVFVETILIALENKVKPGVQPLENLYEQYGRYVDSLIKAGVELSVEEKIVKEGF